MVRALLALVLLCLPSSAHAWGELGHRIVCEIAYAELTPTAKAEVDRLMALDEDFETFGKSCSWADTHARPRRAEEHYVNVPRDFLGFSRTECPLADKCVLTAIEEDSAVLASNTATDEEKLESLKFLGHWVGDIHQPLHVGFQDDRGGNDIKVTGLCSGNLHSAWDSCLLEHELQREAPAEELEPKKIAQGILEVVPQWARSFIEGAPILEWANTSFLNATIPSANYCYRKGSSCWYSEGVQRYGESVVLRVVDLGVESSGSVALNQVLAAGLRLAYRLNHVLGKPTE